MNETIREFAEFVGRCLARRWQRERNALKGKESPPETHEARSAPGSHQLMVQRPKVCHSQLGPESGGQVNSEDRSS